MRRGLRRQAVPARRAAAARVAELARPVVFTNGVFDILHRGHVTYLAQARALGASLVIGLNSDRSARALGKAPDRPLNSERDRACVLAALESVSLVTLFDEADAARAARSSCGPSLREGRRLRHRVARRDGAGAQLGRRRACAAVRRRLLDDGAGGADPRAEPAIASIARAFTDGHGDARQSLASVLTAGTRMPSRSRSRRAGKAISRSTQRAQLRAAAGRAPSAGGRAALPRRDAARRPPEAAPRRRDRSIASARRWR